MRDLTITEKLVLPAHLFTVRFSRSGGPGGQHVNKASTKVDLRLDLNGADQILGEAAVERIRTKLATRLDADGRLQVVSSEYREQARNVDAAFARMQILIRESLVQPKKRRPTKPTRASRERRLDGKRRRSQIKRWRSPSEE